MNKKMTVAQGIMDAKEYRDINLASVDAVQTYAENGCGVTLTDAEAEQVLTVCRTMIERINAGEIPSTNDWYHDFDKQLSE